MMVAKVGNKINTTVIPEREILILFWIEILFYKGYNAKAIKTDANE